MDLSPKAQLIKNAIDGVDASIAGQVALIEGGILEEPQALIDAKTSGMAKLHDAWYAKMMEQLVQHG